MNKVCRCLLGFTISFTCVAIAPAQGQSQGNIPKVLQITREYTKAGKAGMVHEKAERAFVQAMASANFPTHYLAVTSLSGKTRALFLTRYASLEDWEKDNNAVEKNATLSAALDRAVEADGELLDSVDQGVFLFNEEQSLRPMSDLSHMRYLEVSVYHVRPGHGREWREGVKMVKEAYEKGVPTAHWGMFEQLYGGDGGTHLLLVARKTLAEVDQGPQDQKKFAEAMGEEGMKRLDELVASCIESSQHQLFAFNPRMSYADPEWIKSDPDFWKPKPAAKPAMAEKKAQP
jgi:hypothetical protein